MHPGVELALILPSRTARLCVAQKWRIRDGYMCAKLWVVIRPEVVLFRMPTAPLRRHGGMRDRDPTYGVWARSVCVLRPGHHKPRVFDKAR